MASETELTALQRRVADLEQVCAEAYQFAGTVGAPERVLDNLSAAAEGLPISHDSILPVTAEECDAITELQLKLEQVRQALGPVENSKVPALMEALRKSMASLAAERSATPKKQAMRTRLMAAAAAQGVPTPNKHPMRKKHAKAS